MLNNQGSRAFAVVLGLTFGAVSLHATNKLAVTITPASAALTCNTATGPGTAISVLVKPATGATLPIVVTLGSLTNGVVAATTPSITTLSSTNASAGITYTFNAAAGCVGSATGAYSVPFLAGGVADASVSGNLTLTNGASGLSVSPSAVTVTCVLNSTPAYIPGPAQTVSVTSAATGGTPFTVDTTSANDPSWLTLSSTNGGTASSSAVTFTVAATPTVGPTSGCGGYAAGSSHSVNLHLLNAPAPDKLVPVTLLVQAPTPLTFTPATPSFTYIKGSGNPGYVDVHIASALSPAPFFSVDTTTLPIWLTVDSTSGTVPKSLRFSSTSVVDSLAPGTYTASVSVNVSGYSTLPVQISMLVNNKAPKLTISGGTTQSISWTLGTAVPTASITAVSSDSPIPFTVSTGGTLAPIASFTKGLAFSYGTPIGITFNPLIFASAVPGSTLTGTVTLTWGSPASTIVVTLNVSVLSPGAAVSGLNPASLPTAVAPQTFSVVLTGSGFVPSTDPTQKTKVGVVIGGVIVTDTNIASNVVNPSNIILTVTVPSVADTNLPFAPTGTGGNVILGVCNPLGTSCSTPTGTATLSIGGNPIVQAVTNSASFQQVTAPNSPSVAPFDMISIFGTDFCSSGGTGCSSTQVLYGSPDPLTLRYPVSLSPDASGATQRSLSVTFQTHGSSTVLGTGTLLFATNSQINVLVPSGLSAQIGSPVDVVVNFGYGAAGSATMKSSAAYPVNIVATDPGIFTIGADGQGDGAALGPNYSVINVGNPAGMRSVATDSDIVSFYVTGLGLPDSSADNSAAGSGPTWSSDCVNIATYLNSLNAKDSTSLTNVDGTVIQSALLNTKRLPPCITTSATDVPTVTIGGVAGVVKYAGFVADSVASLYQVNVQLPATTGGPFTSAAGATLASIATPVQLPVVITANSKTSQTGVSIWVQPSLLVTAPVINTGTVGVQWLTTNGGNAVTVTDGTGPYTYAVTSGSLPAGLTLGAPTGAITGMPQANTAGTYTVTVTATDTSTTITGSATFSLTIAGGLYVSNTTAGPYTSTFGTGGTITRAAASGGTAPYTYALTLPSTVPVGMALSTSGALSVTSLTPAGNYNINVLSTDSTGLTGNDAFALSVYLHVTKTGTTSGTASQANTLCTVAAAGATGTPTFAIASANPPSWLSVDSASGVVSTTSSAVAGSYTILVSATDSTSAPGASSPAIGTISITITIN